MFQSSLTSMIRGLRANKTNESEFIDSQLVLIKSELKTLNQVQKSIAIQKLAYLHLLGFDSNFADFNIIELLGSHTLAIKRIGYMAAIVCFHEDTPVLMLCTNQIRKDLSSNNYHEASIALHALAQIVNIDLSRNLSSDLVGMLNHSKPYIRKRVILVLYRIFTMLPDSLVSSFTRLQEKLQDPDPGLQLLIKVLLQPVLTL